MPYPLSYFKEHGIWEEKPKSADIDIPTDGLNKAAHLSAKLLKRLSTVGGGKHNDRSREDSGVFKAMLDEGLTPEDALATFIASERGQDARDRKDGHFDDYVRRTVREAVTTVRGKKKKEPISDSEEVVVSTTEDEPDPRSYFKRKSELDQTPLRFVVHGLIPEEGITGFGGLSGHGKSFVMLSTAKYILTGGFLWGRFKVPNQYPVLYLSPETGDRSLHHRLEKLHIPDTEDFLCRTMSQSKLALDHDAVLKMAKGRVVFLDTLVRFIEGKDEQSARDMSVLNDLMLALIREGAISVVFAHHSPKNARNELDMDAENVFRGSGDIIAIMSAGHGIRKIDNDRTVLQIECVKPRDFTALRPFQIVGRPWIDQQGDFRMLKIPGECGTLSVEKSKRDGLSLIGRIAKLLEKNSNSLGTNEIVALSHANRNKVLAALATGLNDERWKMEKKGKKNVYSLVTA